MANNSERQTKLTESNWDNTERAETPTKAYLWLVLSVLLLCYPFVPVVVLSMKNTGGFLAGFLLYFAPIVLLPFLLFKTISSFSPRTKLRIWLPILSIIIFPIYIMFVHKFVVQNEIRSNGVRTKGKLTLNEQMMKEFKARPYTRKKGESQRELETRNRTLREQQKQNSKPFNCDFKVNGKVFRGVVYINDSDTTKLLKSDSIEIIYSKDYPQIFLYGTEAENF
ncbi:MAG: hypothetical protein IPJ60_03650 [Sphingobacteriaceae bacterium]|nr:hypothetical protein [Sphingobacteriaceae bacterium]